MSESVHKYVIVCAYLNVFECMCIIVCLCMHMCERICMYVCICV